MNTENRNPKRRSGITFLLSTFCFLFCATPLFAGEPAAAATPATATNNVLDEAAVTKLLAAALQDQFTGGDGELDLHFTRPWVSTNVPPGELKLKIVEMPPSGVTSTFIVRFDILADDGANLGDWQMPVQAHLWRDIHVARSMLKPGQLVADADIALERRDVLALRAPLAEISDDDTLLEIAETVPAGTPVYQNAVRLRAVIHRGDMTTARLEDGALIVTVKVQALEDGTPGQTIRLRNLDSDHDLTGKVLDAKTVLVTL